MGLIHSIPTRQQVINNLIQEAEETIQIRL
jgi:hypothetical protein